MIVENDIELYIVILFLGFVFLPIFFFSIKHFSFYKDTSKLLNEYEKKINNNLNQKNIELIYLKRIRINDVPNKIFNTIKVVLPGFFGASERSFYWFAKIKSNTENHDSYIEITESIYKKTCIVIKNDNGTLLLNEQLMQ